MFKQNIIDGLDLKKTYIKLILNLKWSLKDYVLWKNTVTIVMILYGYALSLSTTKEITNCSINTSMINIKKTMILATTKKKIIITTTKYSSFFSVFQMLLKLHGKKMKCKNISASSNLNLTGQSQSK